ncbi:MAG: TonB-dependent siderophore receptor [Alphaproteobacteria bacterium]|nr:TonB-dependent siderophore receptor [Alphaproteobacteria bacterium]
MTAPRDGVRQTTAGPVRGYQALTSQSATKVETPLEEIPQSIQVVPRRVIDDQGAITQSEAIRNVSGVQPLNPLFPGQLGPTVRGLAAERFVDGLPNYYDIGARDLLVNVERIEVLKGPSSILYQGGQSPNGGVVNVISKLPSQTPASEFGVTVGSYGFFSPYFDVNHPLNEAGTVLFRVTGQYEDTRSAINTLSRQSFSFNPTITFTNKETTTFTLQGHLSQRHQQDYSGLPTVGTLDRSSYSIRTSMFPGDSNLPKVDSRLASLTARLDHSFNDTWSTFTVARISSSRYREPAQTTLGNTPFFPPSTFGVFNAALNEDNTEFSLNSNLVGKFESGPLRHTLLFGVDYNRVSDKGIFNGDLAGLVDYANPVFPAYVAPAAGPFTTFTNIRNTYIQQGATAQLQTTAWGRLHLLAALRLARVDIRSNELTTASSFHTDQAKLLPRVGIAYDVLPGLTAFAGYTEGLRAVAFFNGPTAPKPEGSRQIEAGIKVNLASGLSGTVSVFEIQRSNVVTTPSGGFTQVQTGGQRSRGFETDLIWQPVTGLSVLAAFAHEEPVVTSDGNPALVGKQLAREPRDSGRLWVNYQFQDERLAGLSLGAGAYAASSQVVELGSPWRTPGYVTFDTRIAYQIDSWTVALTGKNLADRKYLVPYGYLSGRVAPADGRLIYLSASKRF